MEYVDFLKRIEVLLLLGFHASNTQMKNPGANTYYFVIGKEQSSQKVPLLMATLGFNSKKA